MSIRWNRQPAIVCSKFVLNPADYGLETLLPPTMNKIQDREGVYSAISHCFRNTASPKNSSDIAFDCLRKLNVLSTQFKKRIKQEATDQVDRSVVDTPLYSERVQYMDANVGDSDSSPVSSTVRPLPLFLLDGALFPLMQTALQIFEPRYLKMMEDIKNNDELFGYIHSMNGSVSSVGTMCKITSRIELEDGRYVITIQAVSRFKVKKILDPTLTPYCMAQVETDLSDVVTDAKLASQLEKEAYSYMKYYLRLVRLNYRKRDTSYPVMHDTIKKYRPSATATSTTTYTSEEENEKNKKAEKIEDFRRTAFSFGLLNMVTIRTATQTQLLLQTTDLCMRLKAVTDIISNTTDIFSAHLINEGVLIEEGNIKLKEQAFSDQDDDSDVYSTTVTTQSDQEE